MKINIILTIALLASALLHAQVGINIKEPGGIFHIDPGMNSPTTTTDDVIVKESGFVGLGTTSPTAQLHLNVPAGQTALRVVDGGQLDNRVLVSDVAGYAAWGTMKSSGGQQIALPAATYAKSTTTKLNLLGSTQYKVSASGNYLVFIRWWGRTDTVVNGGSTNAYFYFYKNGTAIDTQEYYAQVPSASTYFTLSTVLVAPDCKKGDYLEIAVRPIYGGWTTSATTHMVSTVTFFVM
ncbi:hypothetical protein CLV62_101161 [Dysgonomonas alginatilytica]|uniref:C1q domain-containing protein n=1 Tax=Dysgonomonas alginatilytica TaxID=1605892 RepID=A0A2V3Q0Q6_9BACT|nr:hypothetical protein [Dysgonomonas alginatilytica]PXV68895.1 hypothetical protein CLV62_101161 [Dysgonomonas alginatilytica]